MAKGTCKEDGCDEPVDRRGWCHLHYHRWWRYGDPQYVPPKCRPLPERFWAKADRDGPIPAHAPRLGPCWEWLGWRNGKGYGYHSGKGHTSLAHRLAWELTHGAIPAGCDIDHLCRNRGCVNPAHLEPVTHVENVRRGDTGKHNRIKTHCPHGHGYDEENTIVERGQRVCRACRRARKRTDRT